jgi:hypothetical protein
MRRFAVSAKSNGRGFNDAVPLRALKRRNPRLVPDWAFFSCRREVMLLAAVFVRRSRKNSSAVGGFMFVIRHRAG